jgi:putative ABC transport system permease protein
MKRESGRRMLLGRALRGRRGRTLLTVGGVALNTLLVLVLMAAHRGMAAGVHAYVGQTGIDLWAAAAGTDNLMRSSGVLPPGTDAVLAALPGVAAADPLLRSFVAVEPLLPRGGRAGAERLTLLSIGYDAPARLGAPPQLAAGTPPQRTRQIALDRAAAHRLRVRVGDSVRVNGTSAEVVGLTRGTNLLATQFLFSTIDDARLGSGLPEHISFVAIRLEPDAGAGDIAREIERRMPGVRVYARDAFVANNLREVAAGTLPLLALITALGLSVAFVLVVMLVQGLVDDRRADVAVLLALGAAVPAIARGLLGRAALIVAAGAGSGAGLAIALAATLDRIAPGIELPFGGVAFAAVLALFLGAGLAAATVPVLRLRRVDPLEAFRT